MTKSVSEAEDLTQMFRSAFRKLNTFSRRRIVCYWLHRLTVNEVLMHFRKPAVRKERTTEDGTTPTRVVGVPRTPQGVPGRSISLTRRPAVVTGGIARSLYCTMSKGMNISRLGRCLDVHWNVEVQLHKARMS